MSEESSHIKKLETAEEYNLFMKNLDPSEEGRVMFFLYEGEGDRQKLLKRLEETHFIQGTSTVFLTGGAAEEFLKDEGSEELMLGFSEKHPAIAVKIAENFSHVLLQEIPVKESHRSENFNGAKKAGLDKVWNKGRWHSRR